MKNTFFWQNNSKMSYSSGYSLRNVYYRYNNRLHFKGYYNDTVYTFDTNNKIIPKFLMDLGTSQLPNELRTEVTGKIVSSPKYYWASAKESLKYIFIVYGSFAGTDDGRINDFGLICYDKLKMDGSALTTKKGKMHFVNDLDGGPDFYPEYVNDSLAFSFETASGLKKYLEKDDTQNTSSKKQELKRMLKMKFQGLDESDNPIIMLVKLKL